MAKYLMMKQVNLNKQEGATLLGMLFVAAILVFVALIAMKILPAYQEYSSVRTVMHAMKQESLNTMSKNEIIESFDRRRTIGYVDVVKGTDLIISKNESGDTVLSVQYQVVKPLFGNLSSMMDFTSSSDGK